MKAVTYRISPARWLGCKLLGALWPGIYVSGLSGLRLEEVPVPQLPGQDWVLCRTRLGGICGTDLGIVFQRQHPATVMQRFVSWPAVLGHENVAEIVEAGGEVTGLAVGQRVTVDPALGCQARGISPLCKPCQNGRVSTCENFLSGPLPAGLGIGYNRRTGGSWGQYFVAHKSQVHPLPDSISDQQAVLTDPLACALHGVLRDRPADGERILIFGGGIIALGVLAALRAVGCSSDVTLLARHDFQARRAEALGADRIVRLDRSSDQRQLYETISRVTDGRVTEGRFGVQCLTAGGFDRVYECTGATKGLTHAFRLARGGGTVLVMGTPQLGMVDMTPTWLKELRVLGLTGRAVEEHPFQPGQKIHAYRLVHELILAGRLKTEGLLTHTYRLEQYREAILASRNRRTSKLIKAAFVLT